MATTLTAMTHHQQQQQQRHDCGGITTNGRTDRPSPSSFNKHSKFHVTNNTINTSNNNNLRPRQRSNGVVDDVSIETTTNCKNSFAQQRRGEDSSSSSSTSPSTSNKIKDSDNGRTEPTSQQFYCNDGVATQNLHQQQQNAQFTTAAAARARAPTPRMQGGIPLPVVPQPTSTMTNNPFNFASSAAMNNTNLQAHIAQQLLLARVVPQLMLPTQNYVPSANSPFSYMLAANAAAAGGHQAAFTPFHLMSAAGGFLSPQGTPSPNHGGNVMPVHNLVNSPQPFVSADSLLAAASSSFQQSSEFKNYLIKNSSPSMPPNVNNAAMTSPAHQNITTNRSQSAMMSPEEIEQRIARLISENEAILEPSPVLLKRRSYIRQPHTSVDASTSSTYGVGQNYGRSLTNGRGLRSQSLIETTTPLKSMPAHPSRPSLAQAMNFHAQVQNDTLEAMNASKLYSCKFCKVGIRHLEDLRRHEDKCGRREEDAAVYKLVCQQVSGGVPQTPDDDKQSAYHISTTSSSSMPVVVEKPLLTRSLTLKADGETNNCNKHPLKKRILAAAELDAAKCSADASSSSDTSNAVSVLIANPNKSTSSIAVHRQKSSAECQPTTTTTTATVNQQRVNIFQSKLPLTTSEQNNLFHPYCVTVKVQGATSYEPVRAGRKPAQVTQSTFTASVRKIRPSHGVYDVNSKQQSSNYSTWSQIAVPPMDSKLNIVMMNGYTMPRPKRSCLKYVVAQRDLNVMRVTHSSYWLYSQKKNLSHSNGGEQQNFFNNISSSSIGYYKSNDSTSTAVDVSIAADTTQSTVIVDEDISTATKETKNHAHKNGLVRTHRCNKHKLKSSSHCRRPKKNRRCSDVKQNSDDSQIDLECHANKTMDGDDSDVTISEDEANGCSDDEQLRLVADEQVWQNDTNLISDLRRRRSAYKNIWNRIKTGVYAGRNHRTPPPPHFYVEDDRCDSAPPAVIGERNIEFFASPSSNENKIHCLLPKNDSSGKNENLISVAASTSVVPASSPFVPSTTEGKVRCEICSKEFAKIGLLRLHMDVHRFEQSSRRYDYKCPNCNSCFRSKNLFQKHFSHAHPQQINAQTVPHRSSSILCSGLINYSTTLAAVVQQLSPTTSKPRPFECTDCNVAFRIHGHLAKHLRSKSHIMRLESLEKVPIGIFAKLEENVDYFTEIDTSDCRNSLKSLLLLVQRLMSTESSPTVVDAAPVKRSESSSSVEYKSTSNGFNLDNSPISIVSSDLWIPPKSLDDDVDADHKKKLTKTNEPTSALEEKNNNECFPPIVDVDKNKNTLSESRCKFCAVDFLSSIELKIHWHADHVLMRDGNYFKCPNKGCEKIYPNRNSLRIHLAAHFYGRTTNGDDKLNDDVLISLGKKLSKSSTTVDVAKLRQSTHLVKLVRDSSSCSTADHSPVSGESDCSSRASLSVSPNVAMDDVVNFEEANLKLKQLKRKSADDVGNLLAPLAKYRTTLGDVVDHSSLHRSTSFNADQSAASKMFANNFLVDKQQIQMPVAVHQRMANVWNPFSPQSLYLAAANPFLMNLHQHKMNNNWSASTQFQNPHINPYIQNGHLILPTSLPTTPTSSMASMFLADQLRCILCQKQCSTPMSLQEHLMSHNPQSRLHVCKFCDAGFTTAQALQAHLPCRQESKVNQNQSMERN